MHGLGSAHQVSSPALGLCSITATAYVSLGLAGSLSQEAMLHHREHSKIFICICGIPSLEMHIPFQHLT